MRLENSSEEDVNAFMRKLFMKDAMMTTVSCPICWEKMRFRHLAYHLWSWHNKGGMERARLMKSAIFRARIEE